MKKIGLDTGKNKNIEKIDYESSSSTSKKESAVSKDIKSEIEELTNQNNLSDESIENSTSSKLKRLKSESSYFPDSILIESNGFQLDEE
jgi:hypothetical protein